MAPNARPQLPGAAGHFVTLMLVGTGTGFMIRFAYYAVLTWTVGGAVKVLAAAGVVAGFGWLGLKLTGRIFWWYAAASVAGIAVLAVLLLALG